MDGQARIDGSTVGRPLSAGDDVCKPLRAMFAADEKGKVHDKDLASSAVWTKTVCLESLLEVGDYQLSCSRSCSRCKYCKIQTSSTSGLQSHP